MIKKCSIIKLGFVAGLLLSDIYSRDCSLLADVAKLNSDTIAAQADTLSLENVLKKSIMLDIERAAKQYRSSLETVSKHLEICLKYGLIDSSLANQLRNSFGNSDCASFAGTVCYGAKFFSRPKEYENVNELIEHFSDKERYSLAIFDGYDYHVGIIFDKHVKKDKNGKIIDGYIFSQEGLESPFIRVSKISEIMQMKYGNNGKMYKKFEVLQGTKSFMPHMSEMELNNAHNAFKIIHKN